MAKYIDADKLNCYFNRMLLVIKDCPPQTEKGKYWYDGYAAAVHAAQSYADALAEKECKNRISIKTKSLRKQ